MIQLQYDAIQKKVSSVVLGDFRYDYFRDVSSSVNRIDGAIRPDGTVIAEKIAGFLNGAQTSLRAQYNVAQKQDVMAILFENLDTESPLYGALAIGTQGLMISKTRTPDGRGWDWTSALTANGLMAGIIVAGIISDKLGRNTWNLDTGEFITTLGTIGGWKIDANSLYSDVDASDGYTYRVYQQRYQQDSGKMSWLYSVQRRKTGTEGAFGGLMYIRGDGVIHITTASRPQIVGNSAYLQIAATDSETDGVTIHPGGVMVPSGGNGTGGLGTNDVQWGYVTTENAWIGQCACGDGTRYSGYAFSVMGDGAVRDNFSVYGTFYAASGSIASSDRNLKNSIAELNPEESAAFIYSLKPSSYKLNGGKSGREHHGFIAQDVRKAMGVRDWGLYCDIHTEEKRGKDGAVLEKSQTFAGLRYEELIADVVATIQSLNERLNKLEGRSK